MTETDFYNSATWMVDRHVSEGRGERVAIRCEGRSTTYSQLQRQLWRAQWLFADLGVKAGDRVAMIMRDDETFPAIFLGAQRSGVIPVPLSTMLRGDALAEIIADSQAQVLIISEAFSSTIASIVSGAPEIQHVVVSGDPDAAEAVANKINIASWADFTKTDEAPVAATTHESQAFWLYSSGTTGVPKGVIHQHGNLEATVDTYATEILGINENDRCLSVAKLFFAFGLGNCLTFPFAVGATTILNPDPPSPALMASLLAQEKPTLFFASPGFCAAMLDSDVDSEVFSTLRATVTAGESLPADVHSRFTALSQSPVLDGIGSTELLHIFISNSLDEQAPGTSGRVVPGYAAELRDDHNNPVTEPDSPGYLFVKGPSAAAGYWDRPDATATAFCDGWVCTGDVYERSSDNQWTFLGRNNDMIKAGGIWVSPAEVEGVLIEHPSVLESAVVGSRDVNGLETVVAFVVPARQTTIDAAQLEQHCRDKMASFKRPRQIHVVDTLPKTATGKIKRFELRSDLTEVGRS